MSRAAALFDSESLADHVGLVKRQVDRSLRDRQTHGLAKRIVEANPDEILAIDGHSIPIVYAWGLEHQLTASVQDLRPARTKLDEIVLIWNFVVLNVRYQLDPVFGDTPEVVQTTALTLDQRAGDCDDMTVVLASLLRARGFRVRARVINASGPSDVDGETYAEHIYAQVKHGGKWLALDPVVRGAYPGYEYPGFEKVESFPL